MTIEIASADDPRYGELLAVVEREEGHFLGERYDERGVKQIAVDVGATDYQQNAQIRIGRDFFTTALKEYNDWKEKWFRECVQNSVDGGAKNIEIFVDEREDGVYVSCEDDGRGMDQDVLLNKFLVLGGTTKVGAGGSTGGFGKAKELLVLPWLSWSVHTRDTIVDGSGIDYEVKVGPFRRGTKIAVVMPPDEATNAAAAEAFISKCYLPGVHFSVNGKTIRAGLRNGEEVNDFDGKALLFHNKKTESAKSLLLVRANGLYMFNIDVPGKVPGTLILEITRPSIEILTANRDGFRDNRLKWAVESFLYRLAADVVSALEKKKGHLKEVFRGTGRFEVTERDIMATMLESEGALLPDTKTLSSTQIDRIAEALEHADERDRWGISSEEEKELSFKASADTARAMLDDLKMAGPTQVEAAIAQLSWRPDFILMNQVDGFRVPSNLRPDKMSVRLRQLMTYWAELCRFVLIQLGSRQRYGVGIIISDKFAAAYVPHEGEDWLVLNPYKRKPDGTQSWDEFYTLTDKDDLAYLYAMAVHECTHIADGIDYHDESFSTAFTMNVAKTSGKLKQLTAIRKAVTKREAKDPDAKESPRREKASRGGTKVQMPPWAPRDLSFDDLVMETDDGQWIAIYKSPFDMLFYIRSREAAEARSGKYAAPVLINTRYQSKREIASKEENGVFEVSRRISRHDAERDAVHLLEEMRRYDYESYIRAQ